MFNWLYQLLFPKKYLARLENKMILGNTTVGKEAKHGLETPIVFDVHWHNHGYYEACTDKCVVLPSGIVAPFLKRLPSPRPMRRTRLFFGGR
jgi:hypothetical protein